MSFLEAEWRKLVMVNYKIDPHYLKNYIPFGTELDYWNNTCYISLVGFMFLNTSIKGFKIPLHVNFEEVNLRFYVKRKHLGTWRRGVVFIKEIVPRPAITYLANKIFHEKYETMKMKHSWTQNSEFLLVMYKWKKTNEWHSIRVLTQTDPVEIKAESQAAFISEHYWGYTSRNMKSSYEYEVIHPAWQQYRVKEFDIKVDFGQIYGKSFQMLNSFEPQSVFLLEGSGISVKKKKVIKQE